MNHRNSNSGGSCMITADPVELFHQRVLESQGGPLCGTAIDAIQVNVGLRCNLKCAHCHVAAGPGRREQMDWATMETVLRAAEASGCRLIDITGGAPEMNPHFCAFIRAITESGTAIQVRTNLTILIEQGYEDFPAFMKDHRVALVASLPCYLEGNVDRQRGDGVFEQSIRALRALNRLGYGIQTELPLVLVYNPQGPTLPPPQQGLEDDYRRELLGRYGIRFTRLVSIANMPIGRFWVKLRTRGHEQTYMEMLQDAFNPETIPGLMCRHQVSVDWNGDLYDCDFNLALKIPVNRDVPRNIHDFDPGALKERRIVTGRHCFGCTAGRGSSCGGEII